MTSTRGYFWLGMCCLFGLSLFSYQPCFAGTKAGIEQNPVPIPAAEQGLPTENAREVFVASSSNNILEGAIIDRGGNLLYCDITQKKVMRLTPDKKLSTVVSLPDMGVGGLALSEDGRLFMAGLDLVKRRGAIFAWSPETGKIETIVPIEAGYLPNDLVSAPDGGFYFSDFRGNASDPKGGIYYVSPDFSTITSVIPNLAQANGVAISPDGKTLWATEFAKNRLHRASLEDATSISVIGSSIPYYFIGSAPDSMRVDGKGNVYVAIYGQGRVLVFNSKGIPIGQILLPEREKGLNLLSTSLAVQPDGKDVFIVSSNSEKELPAKIFVAKSPAASQSSTASGRK